MEHRTSTLDLTLRHADGTPVGGQSIQVHQKTHDFLFGCGAFDAVALMRVPEEKRSFLEERMHKWVRLFNYGTLPFYWGRYEPEEGKTVEKPTMEGARYLTEKGVRVKGHPLCWHTACAPWLLNYPDDVIFQKQMDRIRRDVTAFKGTIDMWDVINEVVIMPDFDRYDNAVTRICRLRGRVPLVKACFEAARACNPDAVLLINDFNTSPRYEELIAELLEHDVPISAIGIQSHQHQGYWGREKLEDVLSRFSRFGLPIHFTENTLISGDLMPGHVVDLNDWQVESWPSTPEGEERQAREAAEMYSILFAHPLVEAITTWDFTDGCWLHAPSGFLREDNSEKPVYHTLEKLIHGDWETHLTLSSSEDGRISFTGFHGDYEITAEGRTVSLHLGRENQQLTVTI